MNMKVDLCGVTLNNPVMTASGTFGAGEEYSEFVDLNRLGAVVTKGDVKARIAEIQEEQELSYAEAAEFVEHVDDCRVAYHSYYTGLTWGNANDYDVCLDTVRLGVEKTAQAIVSYVEAVL